MATSDERRAEFDRIERPLTLIARTEQTLRRAVAEGVFPSGRLPTTVELAEQLGVSRETVRLALEAMQRDGLIVKHRRRGTFVAQPEAPTRLTPTATILGYLQADYGSGHGDGEVITGGAGGAMLEGALAEAGDAGYPMVVRSSQLLNLRQAFEQLIGQTLIRGIVFASLAEEKFLRRLGGLNLPAVLLDHDLHLPKIGSIRPDTYGSAALSVAHLAELGHRRIALAHWHQHDLNPWHLRGYREGMAKSGLRVRRTWELSVRITPEGAAEAVRVIGQLSPRPTAVICFNNALASFIIDAAHLAGLRVPEDLSVIGGGGTEVLGLTCVQQDWHNLGRRAVRRLLLAIEEGDQHHPEHEVVPYQLRPGRTTTSPMA